MSYDYDYGLPEGIYPDALPAGIQLSMTRQGPRFRVRFTIEGARIHLGTFNTFQEAMDAMIAFKRNDKIKHSPIKTQTIAKQQQPLIDEVPKYPDWQIAEWNQKLDMLPTALLTAGKPYEDVPAEIVTTYLNNLYNSLSASFSTDAPFDTPEADDNMPSFADLLAAEQATND